MKEIISAFVLAFSLSVPAQAEMVETAWTDFNNIGGETQVFIDTDSIQNQLNQVLFEYEQVYRTPSGTLWGHIRLNVMTDCYKKTYVIDNILRVFSMEGQKYNSIEYIWQNYTVEERTRRVVPDSLLAHTIDFACDYIGF